MTGRSPWDRAVVSPDEVRTPLDWLKLVYSEHGPTGTEATPSTTTMRALLAAVGLRAGVKRNPMQTWVKLETLERAVGVSRHTVVDYLKEATRLGWLAREVARLDGMKKKGPIYTLTVPRSVQSTALKPYKSSVQTSAPKGALSISAAGCTLGKLCITQSNRAAGRTHDQCTESVDQCTGAPSFSAVGSSKSLTRKASSAAYQEDQEKDQGACARENDARALRDQGKKQHWRAFAAEHELEQGKSESSLDFFIRVRDAQKKALSKNGDAS